MTAPPRSRTASAGSSRGATTSATRGRSRTSGSTATSAQRDKRKNAARKAYAKRAKRGESTRRGGGARATLQRWPRSRVSFVVVLMVLMVAGVATSLWLSTQAIADSYRLERLKEQNSHLAERAENLRREVGQLRSPSSLAERAEALGMVPAGNPARLVVKDDGSIAVVGEPVEAKAPEEPARKKRTSGSADETADADSGGRGTGDGDPDGSGGDSSDDSADAASEDDRRGSAGSDDREGAERR